MNTPLYVVIPNWNGFPFVTDCLDALLAQTVACHVVLVDNGSSDGSREHVQANYPDVHVIALDRNYGFTGGVNPGLAYALDHDAEFAVLLNNDAVPEPTWLECLVRAARENPAAGIVTSKFMHVDGNRIDSTGDFYSVWGLPFPRGRDEVDNGQYDDDRDIFGASGGASLYRAACLREIGLFDQRYFAYYEDIDISFRAQLRGWTVRYEPTAVARHKTGSTSSRHLGLGRYHTVKNFVYLYTKNMPAGLWWKYLPRYVLMTGLMFGSDLKRGQAGLYLRATWEAYRHLPGILRDRRAIQRAKTVSNAYVDGLLYHRLPPTQRSFAALRQRFTSRAK